MRIHARISDDAAADAVHISGAGAGLGAPNSCTRRMLLLRFLHIAGD
jgi:hypothetical protein